MLRNKKEWLTTLLFATFLFVCAYTGVEASTTTEPNIEEDFLSLGEGMMDKLKYVLVIGGVIAIFIIYKVQKNK